MHAERHGGRSLVWPHPAIVMLCERRRSGRAEIDPFLRAAASGEPSLKSIFPGQRLGDAREMLSTSRASPSRASTCCPASGSRPALPWPLTARSGFTPCGCNRPPASATWSPSAGALPEIDEVEPNNDFPSPEDQPATTVNGVVENEDVDYLPWRRRRASGSPSRWKDCGWANRSSIRRWRSSTPSVSCWPRPTTRRLVAGLPCPMIVPRTASM